ncbi:MAG: UDP-N-acetylmuramoyl-L-alanyl-D-glutamate--2,6-diaminopimelate ligase [Eubacteriales bacterium]|nr:UDP-N-acetylmuramoyl-L-alanyl-D-glutamate--2,6-diaminopimelate ligase [Eubacteriales bacterium]
MKLSKMFRGQPDIEITGLQLDSRKVEPGNMFFCVVGNEMDGHKFAGKAAEAGAAAIICTEDIEQVEGVVYIKVDDMHAELNRVANIFYGRPSEKMIMFGATGTNGKSTLTSIISDVYSHYEPCGYMGTIAIRYGDVSRKPNLTTPDELETQANLAEMAEHGMRAVAMEVSSQGLAMHRVDGVDFDVAIFTNLTRDHLDYHKTMENYFEAKKILFKNLKEDAVAVLNQDDVASIDGLKECSKCRIVTYGLGKNGHADYQASEPDYTANGIAFNLTVNGREYQLRTNLVAEYNLYNLLGAIAAMHESGMPMNDIRRYITDIPQVEGRMQPIEEGQDFSVVVDYAHTPDGYEKIFDYAEKVTTRVDGTRSGRILAVFGCPGKRDHGKRPDMGRIAASYCAEIVLTTQDPRDEDPYVIKEDIIKGIRETGGISIEEYQSKEEEKAETVASSSARNGRRRGRGRLVTTVAPSGPEDKASDEPCVYRFVPDRYEAICQVMKLAHKGDIVLLLGKGGETYMYYEEGRRPWMSDIEAARKALRSR